MEPIEDDDQPDMVVVGLELEPEPEPEPAAPEEATDIIQEVLEGKWGVGQDRRLRLSQAGYDHRKIEAEVIRRANHR